MANNKAPEETGHAQDDRALSTVAKERNEMQHESGIYKTRSRMLGAPCRTTPCLCQIVLEHGHPS
jgi:hypothetical protein